MLIGQHLDRQDQRSPLYDFFTDQVFLDKWELDELARTLQEEKVVLE